MRTWVRLFVLILSAILPARAWAYTINGTDSNLQGWNTAALRVNANFSACPPTLNMYGILVNAMAVWNAVPGLSISLSPGVASGTAPETAFGGHGPDSPVVICDPQFAKTTSADSDTTPGLSGVATMGGRLVYGYILLNADPKSLANIGALGAGRTTVVLAHELGHVLGLGHSADPAALMYFDVTGKEQPVLSADDIAGIMHLYPKDRPIGDSGGGTCSTTRGRGSGGSGNPLTLAWLLACAAGVGIMRRKPA